MTPSYSPNPMGSLCVDRVFDVFRQRTRVFLMLVAVCTVTSVSSVSSVSSAGTLRLGEIVRLKGQETNTLQGLGLVVGLSGTGDADAMPTARALARMMQLMGGSIGTQPSGMLDLNDVAAAKNVAMVFVTATIPAVGAQSGDQIDIQVHAINAKSLAGGTLMLTPLLGPRADNPTVYAMAQGPISTSPDSPLTTGKIQGGAKMEANIPASFMQNGKITLVLRSDFASFDTAQRIEKEINSSNIFPSLTLGNEDVRSNPNGVVAKAIDQLHVEVTVPELFREHPIQFIWPLEDIQIHLPSHSNRVVINEREGVVVIGKDVEIAPVLINHEKLRIETGSAGFVPLNEQNEADGGTKLKALANALNALDVPTKDLIAIIKTLQRKGDLFGEVIYQ